MSETDFESGDETIFTTIVGAMGMTSPIWVLLPFGFFSKPVASVVVGILAAVFFVSSLLSLFYVPRHIHEEVREHLARQRREGKRNGS